MKLAVSPPDLVLPEPAVVTSTAPLFCARSGEEVGRIVYTNNNVMLFPHEQLGVPVVTNATYSFAFDDGKNVHGQAYQFHYSGSAEWDRVVRGAVTGVVGNDCVPYTGSFTIKPTRERYDICLVLSRVTTSCVGEVARYGRS